MRFTISPVSPLYPILDASYLPPSLLTPESAATLGPWDRKSSLAADEARRRWLSAVVDALAEARVTMLQYRNKQEPDLQVERDLIWLRKVAPASLRIIVNDRLHLVRPGGCQGLHVGQGDVTAGNARAFLGADFLLGLSTHTAEQMREGDAAPVDYLAVGPIYATGTKLDAEAPVGNEGLRRARALTSKPLVAIGGITLAQAAELRAAGADSLAVISGLFGSPSSPASPASVAKLAKDFLAVFR